MTLDIRTFVSTFQLVQYDGTNGQEILDMIGPRRHGGITYPFQNVTEANGTLSIEVEMEWGTTDRFTLEAGEWVSVPLSYLPPQGFHEGFPKVSDAQVQAGGVDVSNGWPAV